MDLDAGTCFGPYEIAEVIGSGGMGVVFRAHDTRLGRDVAIKFLHAECANDPGRLRRFEHEARATSALNHPNILSVFDIGNREGSPYIVSEFLEGETLRDRLRAGPLGATEGLDIANQVARGLAAAHQKGIVHRDLKPENLFLMTDGRAKILDFGLAKLVEALPEKGDHSQQRSDTRTGGILGTAGYMSPEQVRGETIDHRSDVFSLGAILYEMFSGERAFRGASTVETLHAILVDEPSPVPMTDVPEGIESIIRHCLEKNPANRFQSAHDLAFHLGTIGDGSLPVRPRFGKAAGRRRYVRPIAAGIGALATVAAVIVAMKPLSRQAEATSHPIYSRLTFRQGNIAEARFAPDGQTIVYGAAWDGRPMEIFTTRIDGPESRHLGLSSGSVFSVSSQGMLAISEGCELNWGKCRGTLAQVSMSGVAPRKIAKDVDWAEWTPDGKELAIVRPLDGFYRLEYPIGRVVYQSTGWIMNPRFSPDGKYIAFFDRPDFASTAASLMIVDRNGKTKVLSEGWSMAFGLAWRSKDEVWFNASRTTRSVQTMAVDLQKQERVVVSAAGDFEIADISAAGDALFLRTTVRARTFVGDGSTDRELSWFDWSTVADISDDGQTLLFYEWGDGARGVPEVYIRSVEGTDAIRLGSGKALALSPDRMWALALNTTPRHHLALLPTGAGEKRLLPTGEITEYYNATFFPDGKRLLISGEGPDHVPGTYVQSLADGAPQRVGAQGLTGSVLSPDGQRMAVYAPDGRFLVMSTNGYDPVEIGSMQAGDRFLQWSADSNTLYVRGAGDESVDIDRIDLSTGRREPWKRITPSDRVGMIGIDVQAVRMTRDGKSYAYTYWKTLHDLYCGRGLQ